MTTRMTTLRRAMLEILERADGPLTVPELQKQLTAQGLTPHKTSLYRSLEKLTDEHLLHEVLLDNSHVYYERERKHHHHAKCTACPRVICIAHDKVEEGIAHLEQTVKAQNFAATDHHIVLHGLCDTCQK